MPDDLSVLFSAIAAAFDDVAAAKKAAKEARLNSPEARAARSARSLKAAATMRARRAAQRAQEERDAREPVGPTCDAFGIILQAQEVTCARPPHLHGDHETIDGDRWPSYEGEFDEMLTLTTTHLRELLDSKHTEPVLYVARDEDTNEPVKLEVGPEALAHHADTVGHRYELVDALGGPDHPDRVTEDTLEHQVEGWQNALEDVLQAEEIPDDACVLDGEVYPEHDFPTEGEGNECRRCGAEADGDGPDGVYDGEVR